MARTVANTTKLSDRLLKPSKALSKSIGFGATKNPPPNEVKCQHMQNVLVVLVSGPTCGTQGLNFLMDRGG